MWVAGWLADDFRVQRKCRQFTSHILTRARICVVEVIFCHGLDSSIAVRHVLTES